jgi:hypothetical protein
VRESPEKHALGRPVTHEYRRTLVLDTDTKKLYVEHERAYLEAQIGSTIAYQTATKDIVNYLTRGQTAGHRELWRLVRTRFNENSDRAEYADRRHLRLVNSRSALNHRADDYDRWGGPHEAGRDALSMRWGLRTSPSQG